MIGKTRHSTDARTGRQERLDARAGTALRAVVRAGARSYDRMRDLPTLVRIDPAPVTLDTAPDLERIVARLERALRAERHKALSGHWTYDLNRHIALRQAFVVETERLAKLSLARK